MAVQIDDDVVAASATALVPVLVPGILAEGGSCGYGISHDPTTMGRASAGIGGNRCRPVGRCHIPGSGGAVEAWTRVGTEERWPSRPLTNR